MEGIPTQKKIEADKLRRDIDNFLKGGGKITKLDSALNSGEHKDPRFAKARERARKRDEVSRAVKS